MDEQLHELQEESMMLTVPGILDHQLLTSKHDFLPLLARFCRLFVCEGQKCYILLRQIGPDRWNTLQKFRLKESLDRSLTLQ